MLFVYVDGIANSHQYARPRKKPLPLAETRSRTIIPSSLATSRLRYVRRRRKKVCSEKRNTSLLVDLNHASSDGSPRSEHPEGDRPRYQDLENSFQLSEEFFVDADLVCSCSSRLTGSHRLGDSISGLSSIGADWRNKVLPVSFERRLLCWLDGDLAYATARSGDQQQAGSIWLRLVQLAARLFEGRRIQRGVSSAVPGSPARLCRIKNLLASNIQEGQDGSCPASRSE